MKRPLTILLFVLIAGGGFLYWRSLPQNALPRKVRELVDKASFDADVTQVGRTAKALTVSDFFTDPVRFETPYDEVGGEYKLIDLRSNYAGLTQWATMARFSADAITVEDFSDVSGEVTASVNMDAIFSGGSSRSESSTATFHFVKVDSDWLIERVVLEKE